MTQEDQLQFVLDLTARVAKKVCEEIRAGAMPDYWSETNLAIYVTEVMCETVDKL